MERRKLYILCIALLSYFMTAIDASIVITGLTKIAADLQLTQEALSWVQNAYVLSFGSLLLLGGRLSDVCGRKRILYAALCLFSVGSILCGAAQAAPLMIGARLLQGIGAALLAPTSMALLIDTFSGEERTKAIAWYSSISGLGSSFGLMLGGLLADTLSWRLGFYLNLPVACLMAFLAHQALVTTPILRTHFDIAGTFLSVSGIFSLAYAIDGAASPWLWLIAAALLLTAFVKVEQRSIFPIVPLQLFTHRTRSTAYIIRAIFVGVMMGYWFFSSEFMQLVNGYSPLQAAIFYMPMTLSTFGTAVFVPRIIKGIGNKRTVLLGLACTLLSFALLVFTESSGREFMYLLLPMLGLGLAQGFCLASLTNLGIKGCSVLDAGAASGIVNAAHQTGGSIGLSLMVTASTMFPTPPLGFASAMTLGAIFSAFMLLIAFTLPKE